jgi:hypothetical protein
MTARAQYAVLLCLLFWASPNLGSADPAPGWEAGAADDGPGYRYQVFTQDAEDGAFVRYQVRGIIEATPEVLRKSVRSIAADPDNAPDGQTRSIIESTPAAFVIHTRIALPLLADRDIISRGKGSADANSGVHRIEWRAVDDERAPVAPGVVRVQKAAGFWEFEPLADGTSRVTYETYLDLGGSIPMWLVNTIMKGMVADSFQDVAIEARQSNSHVGATPPKS